MTHPARICDAEDYLWRSGCRRMGAGAAAGIAAVAKTATVDELKDVLPQIPAAEKQRLIAALKEGNDLPALKSCIWEYQRYDPLHLGWSPPAGKDQPAWTDESGCPVDLPKEVLGQDWLVDSGKGDAEGWEYGSAYQKLSQPREGGRGRARPEDFFRRRCWVIRGGTRSAVAASDLAAEAAVRKQEQSDTLNESLKLLASLLGSRPKMHSVGAMSPDAWYRLQNEHTNKYNRLVQELPTALTNEDHVRLRGLLFAARYANAVYGASKKDTSLLANPTYVPILHDDPTTRIEAMLANSGRAKEDLLHAKFDVAALNPAHAILVDHKEGAVVLAIRGTHSAQDALTNCMASADAEVDKALVGDGGSLHAGHLKSARWVAKETSTILRDAARKFPAYRLVVTGHSLGAGVAAILTLLLDAQEHPQDEDKDLAANPDALPLGFKSIEGYAFACPGVASEEVCSSARAIRSVTTLALGRDIIVRMSFRSVDELLYELSSKSLVTGALSYVGKVGGAILRPTTCTQPSSANAPSPKSPRWPQHLPIGRCYFMPDRSDKTKDDCSIVRAEPQQFDRIVLHTNMFGDHSMSRYVGRLDAACHACGLAQLPSSNNDTGT